jgi:hypothetical protein
VARLQGNEDDADAVAALALAMGTFMTDVDAMQQLAGRPGAEDLLPTAVGLYNQGAGAATGMALYQENLDPDALAELRQSMEGVTAWAKSLSGSLGL